MLEQKEIDAILQKRAKNVARQINDEEKIQTQQCIEFSLGDQQRLAFEYTYIDEIIRTSDITHIPCAPNYIKGVINRRSQLLTVLDISPFFAVTVGSMTKSNYVIVIKFQSVIIGICVDDVYGNLFYDKDEFGTPLGSGKVGKPEYIKGTINSKTTLLDAKAILTDVKLRVKERME